MYDYEKHKADIFTEGGQKMFLSIRDRANRLIDQAGAVSMGLVISGETGDTFKMLACVDRLVELKEINEVQMLHPVRGQNRIFVKPT